MTQKDIATLVLKAQRLRLSAASKIQNANSHRRQANKTEDSARQQMITDKANLIQAMAEKDLAEADLLDAQADELRYKEYPYK